MPRMHVSLTHEERRLLDEESARTGRSIAALIRDAVTRVYGSECDETDFRDAQLADDGGRVSLAELRRELDGESYVENLRSGSTTTAAFAARARGRYLDPAITRLDGHVVGR